MSNLMVKNRRTPLYIERKDALFIQEHFMNEKIGNDFKFKVNHAESLDPYTFSKIDIRDVFVNDDKDYWKLRNDLFPPEKKQQIEPQMTPEEWQRSKEAMARVFNIVEQSVPADDGTNETARKRKMRDGALHEVITAQMWAVKVVTLK